MATLFMLLPRSSVSVNRLISLTIVCGSRVKGLSDAGTVDAPNE